MGKRSKFLKDLLSLLEKYGVEFECNDHWQGYPECGQDVRITVEFGDYSTPEIDFGRYIDTDKIKMLYVQEEK